MQPGIITVFEMFGFALRVLGAFVFGVGTGWLTVRALGWQHEHWQAALGIYLGLLATFVLVGHWVDGGGTLGALGLGAGAGLLIWGLGGERVSGEE
ncbi:MAG: hypothetical protein WBR18_15955 [Anaerolineales bacterium]